MSSTLHGGERWSWGAGEASLGSAGRKQPHAPRGWLPSYLLGAHTGSVLGESCHRGQSTTLPVSELFNKTKATQKNVTTDKG